MLDPPTRTLGLLVGTVLLLSSGGCSVQKLAVNSLADALAGGAGVYASDNDPELVRDAFPFALKTYEMLLEQSPDNVGLLMATCQGFTSYSYAFVEMDLIRLELDDFRRYKEQRQRALNLYLRGRDYCLRILDQVRPGIGERLKLDPENAVLELRKEHVELLFWTGSSWGAAIALGADQAELLADLPAVRAMLDRALALDPDFDEGILHDAMVVLESLPEAMGGSVERARRHYERALELHGGARPSTYVTWAELISYGQQNREEFEELLHKALEVDPDANVDDRLATLVSQQRARILLALADDLFL